MRKRRNSAWLVALVAVLMLAVPASGAMGFTAVEKKHEKKQNAAIGKAAKAAARALNRTAALTTAVGQQTKSLADLQTLATGVDNRVKTIEAGIPAVFDALTKLGDAATQLKDGLTALSAGTTAGFAKVTQTFRAVEYGTIGVFGPPAVFGGTGLVGFPLGTADIPDDGNPAGASGSIPVPLTVNAATPAVTLSLRGAIRSNETDGGATGDPAGQAGGLLYAVCATAPSCGASGPPQGTLVCTGAPLATTAFPVPGGTANLAATNIQQKSGETDSSAPSNTATELTSTQCTIPAGGGTYIVTAQAQFFDLPTSATPSNTD